MARSRSVLIPRHGERLRFDFFSFLEPKRQQATDRNLASLLRIPRDGEQRFHGMVNSLRRRVARCSRSWKSVHDRGKWGGRLEINRKAGRVT